MMPKSVERFSDNILLYFIDFRVTLDAPSSGGACHRSSRDKLRTLNMQAAALTRPPNSSGQSADRGKMRSYPGRPCFKSPLL
ncbi:MAG: hypothetical protein E5V53_32815, partial [Mesorhizobium sp.]